MTIIIYHTERGDVVDVNGLLEEMDSMAEQSRQNPNLMITYEKLWNVLYKVLSKRQ